MFENVSFDDSLPRYMSYAKIGLSIAQEIAHAFDTHGRWFDKNGCLDDWWSPRTKQNYIHEAPCIIEEYYINFDDSEQKVTFFLRLKMKFI